MLSIFRKMNYLLPCTLKAIFIGIYAKGHVTGVTDALNIEFNDRLFNLTIINIKVHKEGHLEFNFKDGSTINIDI